MVEDRDAAELADLSKPRGELDVGSGWCWISRRVVVTEEDRGRPGFDERSEDVAGNRNGLCVDLRVAPATGHAEREALEMLRRRRRRGYDPKTLGGDKGYCIGDFPQKLLDHGIKPHLAVPDNAPARSPARRFIRSEGYKVSQVIRKRVEEIFGWGKQSPVYVGRS